MPDLDELLRSHDELRAAVILAGKRVRKLQFGRRNDDPVLEHLRKVLREARAVRQVRPAPQSIRKGSTELALTRYTATRLSPPLFSPADLIQVRCVFDDPSFIYELKHNGFGHPVIASKYLDGSPGFGD